MILRIRGHNWTLRRTRENLSAEDAGATRRKERSIAICPGMTNLNELETVIHEVLHACLWDLDEDAIAETAKAVVLAVRKIGWRKQGGKK